MSVPLEHEHGDVSPVDVESTPSDSDAHLTPRPSAQHVAEGQDVAVVVARQQAMPDEGMQDGGLWAWLRVFSAWLLFILTWGPALSYGTFQQYYSRELLSSQSESNISWIGATATTLLIIGGVVAGPLFDRGYLKPLMVAGCFLQVFGFMMLSLSTKYYQIFLSQGICYGIGCGIVYVPALAFVTSSFTKKRALAVGVTTTGASTGGVIFPILFRSLIHKVGFPWTCRTIAFVQLACAILGLGFLYNAPVRKTKPRRYIDWTAFKSVPFNLFFVTSFCQFLSYQVPLFYIPSFATTVLGTSDNLGVYLVVYLNAASAFGRVIPAFAVARFGAAPVLTVASFIATIVMFCWIAIHSLPSFVAWCVIFGFFTGVFISANPLVATHPSITPSIDVLGTRMGMLWFAGGIGSLIGGPTAGALARPAHGDFLNAQGFASAIIGLAFVCIAGVLICIIRWDRNARLVEKRDDR